MGTDANVMLGFILIALCLVVYAAPSIVAIQRGHRNQGSIVATNVLLGWTGLGWCGALIWALSDNVKPNESEA